MIDLVQYITEKIHPLPHGVHGLIVFDIDDTLLKVDPGVLKIIKKMPGTEPLELTTAEYASDPDAGDPTNLKYYDFSDFYNPQKVYQSIITGTPLMKNIRILDDYIDAGYDFCFLTARGCEDTVKSALDKFLGKYSKALGSIFKKTLSHAVNDLQKHYPGRTDAEKKSLVLRSLCKKYDRVVFVDDDKKNVGFARDLRIPNLKVIKAWES